MSEIIPNEDAVREPVRELRSEIPFVRVHRPNQDISTFDRPRDPIALHAVLAGSCGIENVVGEMVRQQIDLVDIEDAAMCLLNQTDSP